MRLTILLAALSSLACIPVAAHAAVVVNADTLEGCPLTMTSSVGSYRCDNGDALTVTKAGNDTIITRTPAAPSPAPSRPAVKRRTRAPGWSYKPVPLSMVKPLDESRATDPNFPDKSDADQVLPVTQAPHEPGWKRVYCDATGQYCLWRPYTPAPETAPPPSQVASVPEHPVPHLRHEPNVEMEVDTPQGSTYVAGYRQQPSFAAQVLGGIAIIGAEAVGSRIAYGRYGYSNGYSRIGQPFYTTNRCSMPPGYTGPMVPCN